VANITELTKVSLRERVARALRAAIISGEMEPGVVYSAPSLGTRFGVSATPVREAMLDLAKEGLVTIAPNKGFRVTDVDDAYMDQIIQLRLLIEPPVTRAVTPLIPAEDLPALHRMAADIVQGAERGDLLQYIEADTRFHLALLAYYNNSRIVELVSDLRGQTRLVGLAGLFERGELAESAQEHHRIVDLVAARDAATVEQFVHDHIRQARGKWAGTP
jgi:DNA-binding GntR family transcriptional regulator